MIALQKQRDYKMIDGHIEEVYTCPFCEIESSYDSWFNIIKTNCEHAIVIGFSRHDMIFEKE